MARGLALVLVTLAVCRTAGAQPALAEAGFVVAVRAGTAPFRDRAAAVQAGYRRIGPDFPGMGEHWVHVPRLMQDGVTPEAPPILSYATIDGRATLVGVAFAVPVEAGAPPPPVPAGCGAWHFHAGTVDGESFLPGHGEDLGEGVQLAVLHAWVWLDNPAGLCASDNWALPYARAGLAPAGAVNPDAARALALLAEGRPYYRARWLRVRPDRLAVEVDGLLDRAAEAVRAVLAERGDPTHRDRRLAEVWRALCAEAGDQCDPGHR